MAKGWLYDGETAVRHDVRVEAGEGALRVEFADGGEAAVRVADLVHVESCPGFEVYGQKGLPGWRLGLPAEEIAALAESLPAKQRYGRLIDRVGLAPALAIGLAVSVLVVLAGSRLPGWLAPLVPYSWEERFGDALVGDFGGRFCEGPGGQQALNSLAGRLSPGAARLNIRVVNAPIVNAAAFPGGNIVIFDELLKEAKSADEAAGVLAHEIAHIEERHTTEAMIRQLGLGMIVTALGGTTGASVETLLSAQHSRGAEAEADSRAIDALSRANISPAGTAGFFARLAKSEGRLGAAAQPLSYLSTHPLSAERQKRFLASAVKGRTYRPALTPQEWQALTRICTNDPKRDEKRLDRFF